MKKEYCNIFSGHIIAELDKNWGKVEFHTGVHHELDREIIYKKYKRNDIRMLAWESEEEASLEKFEFAHDCGQSIPKLEKEALMYILKLWGAKQDKSELILKHKVYKYAGRAIKYTKNPSEKAQLAAVKENGNAIRYIKNPSEKVKLMAEQKEGE